MLPILLLHLLLSLLPLTSASASPSSPSTAPTPLSFVSSDYSSTKSFRAAVLNSTNTYRSLHHARALEWNETLAKYAQKWSDGCVFKHSAGPNGENLSSGYPSALLSIDVWGAERSKYSFSSAKFSKQTGHFTQLVWKATTSVGCARTDCEGKGRGRKDDAPGWYVVCEYWPPGNVEGQFEENVQAAGGKDDGGDKDGKDGGGDKDGKGDGGKDGGKDCPQGSLCKSGARRKMDMMGNGLLILCAAVAALEGYLDLL